MEEATMVSALEQGNRVIADNERQARQVQEKQQVSNIQAD
jgi:hypothetical protein